MARVPVVPGTGMATMSTLGERGPGEPLPAPGNKSAARALDVLTFLSRQPRPVSAATIARYCGLPRSSTYHLLNVMKSRGFLAYLSGERTWTLGTGALTIGAAAERAEILSRLARPILSALASETGEAAMVGVLRGTEVLSIASDDPVDGRAWTVMDAGVALPANLHAAGRALLAEADPRQLRALFPPTRRLATITGRGETTPAALIQSLADERAAGFSQESGLASVGMSSIAAPVFDRSGRPAAAVAIMFRTVTRFGTYRSELAEPVRAAAGELSTRLGGPSTVRPE